MLCGDPLGFLLIKIGNCHDLNVVAHSGIPAYVRFADYTCSNNSHLQFFSHSVSPYVVGAGTGGCPCEALIMPMLCNS